MPKTTLVTVMLVAGGLTAGCAPTTAVVHGQRVARPSLGYTDHQYFAIRHQLAYPEMRGPSSGLWSYGGRIDGRVCGLDVNFESDYYGRHLDVSGSVRSMLPGARHLGMRIDVRDGKHGREISGNMGGRLSPMELYLTPQSIVGRIGQRRFHIDERAPDADELRGTMRYNDYFRGDTSIGFVVRGVQELWAMPPADQAVLLPLMLSCLEGPQGGHGVQLQPLVVIDFRNLPATQAQATTVEPTAVALKPAAQD
jgi:hypothetical protein